MKMRQAMLAHARDSGPLCDAAFHWLADHSFLQVIAVFAALPGEPDLTELVASHPDRKWVYPKVVGEHLAFHVVEDPAADLSPGAFGILEPVTGLPEIPIGEIDAFVRTVEDAFAGEIAMQVHLAEADGMALVVAFGDRGNRGNMAHVRDRRQCPDRRLDRLAEVR